MAEAFSKNQVKETDQRVPDYIQAVEDSIRSPPLGYVVNSHHIKYTRGFNEETKIYDPLIDSLERTLSKPLFCRQVLKQFRMIGENLQCLIFS